MKYIHQFSFKRSLILFVCAFLLVGFIFTNTNTARAADGDLDTTFNPGIATLGANDLIMDSAKQSDGKLIIIGDFTKYNGVSRNHIARLNTDGTLDMAYNPGTGFNGTTQVMSSVAIGPDDKAVIAGRFTMYNGTSVNHIARINTNGTLDTSFDPGTGPNSITVDTVAVQSDGRIIIGGEFTSFNGTTVNKLARLETDGDVDTTFSTNLGLGPNGTIIRSLAVDDTDNIVTIGDFTTFASVARGGIARINADGTFDNSFNPNGGFTNGINNFTPKIRLQSDGKIIIAGAFLKYAGVTVNNIVRTTTTGALDSSFVMGTGLSYYAYSLDIQSDGKILVGGSFTSYKGSSAPGIVRIETNGNVDLSFNTGTGFDGGIPLSIIAKSTGNIAIFGTFSSYNGTQKINSAEILTTGSINSLFNPGTNTGANGDVEAIAVQTSDGKIYIGGSYSLYNGTVANNIVRTSATGVVDPTFVTGTGFDGTVKAIVIDSSGKILIAGNFTDYNGTSVNSIVRLNTNGTIDSGFSVVGADASINAIAIESVSGKIIIGGDFTTYGGVTTRGIARLNTDGTLDATGAFNSSGGFNVGSSISSIKIQSDGKILVGGFFTTYNGTARTHIARLLTTGAVDTSFSVSLNNAVQTIAIQPNNQILIGGLFTTVGGTSRKFIARLNFTNGTLDTTMNANVQGGDRVNTISVQPDGKFIVGGVFENYGNSPSMIVNNIVRSNLDGNIDTSFDVSFGTDSIDPRAVLVTALQSNNKVLFGGSFLTYKNTDINRVGRLDNTPTGVGSIAYSASVFNESSANNGTINNTSIITLTGDTFTTIGVLNNTHYSVSNLPLNLGITITVTDTTHATVALTGAAILNQSGNNVSNLTIAFTNLAFVGGNAGNISGSTTSNLSIVFLSSPYLTYGGGFTETIVNNGTVSGSRVVTLFNDTFTTSGLVGGNFVKDVHYTITTVPGLTPVLTRTSSTVATLTYTGQATAHADTDDILNLTITFLDGAFTSTANASGVTYYSDSSGTIYFNNTITVAFSGSTMTPSSEGVSIMQLSLLVSGGSLPSPYSGSVVVTTSAGGTATAGTDYVYPSVVSISPTTTVTIPSGDYTVPTTIQVNIDIIDDTQVESSETINFTITTPTNVALGAQTTTTATILDNDASVPVISFSPTPYSGSEGTTPLNLSLYLTGGTIPAGGATVVITQTGGTATGSGTDYTFTSPQTISIPGGTTSPYTATVPITITNDTMIEGNETITFSLSSPTNMTLGTTVNTTATINDDDALTVSFGGVLPIAESSSPTTLQLPIIVSGGQSALAGSVVVTVTGGTANNGTDYTFASPYTFTIPAANYTSPQTLFVPITIIDNFIGESSETITFSLSSPSNVVLGTQTTTTATITDNDTTPAVSFSNASYSITEGNTGTTNLNLVLNVSGGTVGAGQTVVVTQTGGSATGGGTDYTFVTPQTVTITPGTYTATTGTVTVPITIVNDTAIEGDETITFSISSPTGGITLGTETTTTATIVDNDFNSTVAQFSQSMYSGSEGTTPLSMTLNVSGGIVGPGVTVPVNITGGTATNSNATVLFNVTNISDTGPNQFEYDVYIINTGTANLALRGYSFGLNLNPALASGGTLTHSYVSNSRSTALATLPAVSASATGAHIRGTTTNATAGNEVLITAGVPYKLARMRVTISASGSSGSISSSAFTNLDPGVEPIQVVSNPNKTQCSATVIVNPGGTPGTSFLVNGGPNVPTSGVLNALTVEMTPTLTTTTTGTTTTDYTFTTPTSISIPAGDYTITPYSTPVSIVVRNESIIESDETIIATLGTPSGGIGLGSQTSATAMITNDDAITIQFSSVIGYTGTEGVGLSLGLAVSGGILSADLTIPLSSAGGSATSGSDYSFTSPTSVTIPAGNYISPAIILVPITIIDDTLIEGDETINFLISSASGITLGTQTTTTATITDNDVLTAQFTGNTYSGPEGTTPLNMYLTVSGGQSTTPASVVVTTTNDTATSSDYTFVSPATISIPAGNYTTPTSITIPVTIINDTVVEQTETFQATLSTPIGSVLGSQTTAIISITDNDSPGFSVATVGVSPVSEGATSTSMYSLVLNTQPTSNVIINVTSDSSFVTLDTSTFTFTTSNWNTPQTVAVTISENTGINPVPTVTITFSVDPLSNSSFTSVANQTRTFAVTDNDINAEFSSATYTVNEATASINLVLSVTGGTTSSSQTFDLTTSGTAASGTDYSFTTPVTISAGTYTAGTTINAPITITNDTLVEATETVDFTLANPSSNANVGTQSTTTLYITDNDAASLAYSGFFAETDNASGGAIRPTGPGSQVVVTLTNATFSISSGTLVNGVDYTTNLATVAPGLSMVVTVTNVTPTSSTAIITLTGTATAHASSNSISNLSITFSNSAFSGTSASLITNSTYSTLSVLFNDATDLDIDGVSSAIEATGINAGDANDDGIPDANQASVSTLPATTGNISIGLAVTDDCTSISQIAQTTESALGNDSSYNYPFGVLDFNLGCTEVQDTASVTLYLDQLYPVGTTNTWVFRKRYSTGWQTMPLAPAAGHVTVGSYTYTNNPTSPLFGTSVTTLSFDLEDGGINDTDGTPNGIINDPIGIAIAQASSSGSGGGGGGAPKCPTNKTGVYPNCVDLVTVCLPGQLFSTTTGAPCTSTIVSCPAGALFSPTTGQACTTTSLPSTPTTSTPPVGIATSCAPLILYPIVLGKDNLPSDVNNLVAFLNTYEGEKLAVDGVYNLDDQQAVNRFQVKYWNEIIAPFGGTRVTGTVGNYTKGKINAMNCAKFVGCPYFTDVQKYGSPTNEQIDRIQTYLNLLTGTNLKESQYNLNVFNAIKKYQTIYKKKILAPYGKTIGTGNWGSFTVKTSNEIMGCY